MIVFCSLRLSASSAVKFCYSLFFSSLRLFALFAVKSLNPAAVDRAHRAGHRR
jgi:hypothetical protein